MSWSDLGPAGLVAGQPNPETLPEPCDDVLKKKNNRNELLFCRT
jgi:hypothetical protein